jgi:hypothetical protein
MMSIRPFAVAVVALAVACSAGSSDEGPKLLTSHQDLCAGAPADYGDHIVTMISCPWEQQTQNITKFGVTELPRLLRDASGTPIATITNTCDTWAFGHDNDGVAVIVRRDTGEVTSHGTTHPGQPISKLGAALVLPLSLDK